MPGRLEFELPLSRPNAARKLRDDEPRRLLMLGAFGAGATRLALAQRRSWRVDLDNVDEVMARMAPQLQLACAGQMCMFEPRALEDFHPDRLLQLLPPLARAADLRQRLTQASTFAQAAAELAPPPASAEASAPADTHGAASAASGADLLGALLGGKPAAAPTEARPVAAAAGIEALLRHVVTPHIVRDAPQNQSQYVAAAEAALAEQLRLVLRDPGFQALEAAWRGVQWLIAKLELDETLELHLFDAAADELRADIAAARGELEQTAVHRLLVDRWRDAPDSTGWSWVAGLYSFGGSDGDVGLLAALGLTAARAGAAFVAGSDESVVEQPGNGWPTLRRSEAAPWLGLAAPQLLLRLPYGPKTDPVAAFKFEEIVGTPDAAQLLWGSAALAIALLAGRGGDARQIDDLPAYSYTLDGEPQLMPCAGRLLGEAALEKMVAAGLMPLASHRQRNAVTVVRLQSIASPATQLF